MLAIRRTDCALNHGYITWLLYSNNKHLPSQQGPAA